MVDTLLVGRVVSLIAGGVLFGLAYRAYGNHDKPAARSFGILLGVLGVTALCAAATAHVGTAYKLVWLYTGLAIPLALAYFAFDYYGIAAFATRSHVVAAATPAVGGAVGGTVLILGEPGMSPGPEPAVAAVAALPAWGFAVSTALNAVGLYYSTGLILLAVGLVFRTVYRYEHLDAALGALVAFVGIWPWLANLAVPELGGALGPGSGVAAVGGGYAVSAVAAGLAVGPLDLFESSPMAGNVGPEAVLDSMDDAVIVVDASDHVLRLNAVACRTFGTTERETIGGPLDEVVGEGFEALATGETVSLDTVEGRREFEASSSPVTDRTGADRGYAVVLRDVTRRRTREQRLEVFNRVLRHNLRNDANSILGRAEIIAQGGDPQDSAERIVDATRGLVRTAERAREIERMLNAPGEAPTPVAPVVEEVVAEVRESDPDVEVTTALPEDATAAVRRVPLRVVLGNLVENGARHNDADEPIVVVSGDYDESGRLAITVADNGPGIPEHERGVVEAGEEDALEHGSGLGLWAVNWGVTGMGGELEFSDNDPRGTAVTVRLPAAHTTADESAVEEPTPGREAADQ